MWFKGFVSPDKAAQKRAPLSGGPPSPKLLAITTAVLTPTRSAGSHSSIAVMVAEIPAVCRSRCTDTAAVSAFPVCDVHRIATSPNASFCFSGIESALVRPVGRKATALTLNSGCSESGSTASLVTALIVRPGPCASFQWNGAKQLPRLTLSLTSAGNSAVPRRDAISTMSPSEIPNVVASCGWISTKGDGCSRSRVLMRPVLVNVCQWCCRRPVLRTTG